MKCHINVIFYKQISCCRMGFSLSIIVPNLIKKDIRNRAPNNLSFTPILYRRYVNDIFAIISFEKMYGYLNNHVVIIYNYESSICNKSNRNEKS